MKPSSASHLLFVILFILSSCFVLKAQVHFRHYTPGHYYDHSGVKHTGFIDFGRNVWGSVKINFKDDSITAANQRIDISDIRSIVVTRRPDTADAAPGNSKLAIDKMVIDSFIVVQETVETPDSTTTDTRLCKFVTSAVNAKIYSRNVQRSGGGFGMGVGAIGAVSIVAGASISYTDTLYLCEADGKTLQIRRSNYKQLLAKAFADYPDLVQKIQNKELKFGDLGDIIRRYVAHKTA